MSMEDVPFVWVLRWIFVTRYFKIIADGVVLLRKEEDAA